MLPLHPVERSNIRISIGSHFSNQTLLELACRQYSNSFLTWAYLLGLNRPLRSWFAPFRDIPKAKKAGLNPTFRFHLSLRQYIRGHDPK